jgi:uncharacterized protein (DUF2267 family)
LAKLLTPPTAQRVAEKLAPELAPFMDPAADAGTFPPENHVRAVMNALRRTVGDDLWADVVAELPAELGTRLAPVDGLAAQEFVARVGSARATDAVLETLAQRVSGDAVEALIGALPIELRAPLRRGKPDRDTRAERLTIEEFAERIAQRAGTTVDEAVADARAVFAVLRQALKEGDFYNLVSQLPLDYSVLLPRP